MPMLAGRVDFVVGVDTHKFRHTAVLVDALGAELEQLEVATTGPAHRQLLDWAQTLAGGRRAWAVEGTGSYGARLTELLVGAGETVFEVDRPNRPGRKRGKSDHIDALAAAREALTADRLARPRVGAERELVRSLLASRQLAAASHRSYLGRLKSDLVHLPDGLREQLIGLSTPRLLARCQRLRVTTGLSAEARQKVLQLRRLAERIQQFEGDIAADERQLRELISALAPRLLSLKGIGAVVAGEFFNAWAHSGRVHSEAALAMLCGAAPIPASSGERIRYRLNRGGDRRLNRCLHQAVLSLLATDDETRRYALRRRAEGKTGAEIRRCLKRFLVRRIFNALAADFAA